MTRTVLLRPWEVRPLLDGSKTMIARPIPTWVVESFGDGLTVERHGDRWIAYDEEYSEEGCSQLRCPFGEPGTVLLCKEWWARRLRNRDGRAIEYKASSHSVAYKWRPPQHMPPWAVRIRPFVVSVAAKRCTEITDEEAIACGLYRWVDTRDGKAYYGKALADVWEQDPRRALARIWSEDNPRHPWESSWAWLATVSMVTP